MNISGVFALNFIAQGHLQNNIDLNYHHEKRLDIYQFVSKKKKLIRKKLGDIQCYACMFVSQN